MHSATYGFRIRGGCWDERRPIDWAAAFQAYADCDTRADVQGESFLSAFCFEKDLLQRDDGWKLDLRGFDGPCWSKWVWFDIDRTNDLESATLDARRLSGFLANRYQLDGDEMLIFFSGSKGFHIGLPVELWNCEPSRTHHRVVRHFASDLAAQAKVMIDSGIYDKVRAFRAPNSRHPKTGLHKRRLEYGELMHVKTTAIVERAAAPIPFDLPAAPHISPQAACDWELAVHTVAEVEAVDERRCDTLVRQRLNRLTSEFIRQGAPKGERSLRLFSAAKNLREFECPRPLAHALLTEPALDCGLPPAEVSRQIECGLGPDLMF